MRIVRSGRLAFCGRVLDVALEAERKVVQLLAALGELEAAHAPRSPDWGEPYQRLSVPQQIRRGPTCVISLPSRWAASSGSFITSRQTEPSSAYTFGTLPKAWPFFLKRLASQLFSRRLLIRPSTVFVVESAAASPR